MGRSSLGVFATHSGATYWEFATEAIAANIQPEHETQSSTFVYLFHNKSSIYQVWPDIASILEYRRLHSMPYVKLTNNVMHGTFGAVASTSLNDRVGRLSAYVSVKKDFSLLDFSVPRREIEQIYFNKERSMDCDINHMQCILDVSKNRRGIIVQRSNGSVEFWEDRQPKSPSVIYVSEESLNNLPSSPHPPVVEWPMQSMVAICHVRCRAVLISRLETGEPVNVLEYPDCCKYERHRKIIFRSEWSFDRSLPSPPGPILATIDVRTIKFFYKTFDTAFVRNLNSSYSC